MTIFFKYFPQNLVRRFNQPSVDILGNDPGSLPIRRFRNNILEWWCNSPTASNSPPTMAVPAEFTILDISGKFVMNTAMSGDTDRILTLQGVGWIKRKAISLGTVTLAIKHYKDDAGVERVDIDQTLTGGVPGTREERILTWTERENEDHLFGAVIGKSRRVAPSELEEEFLKTGWTADTVEHGLIESYVYSDTPKSNTTWIGDQTWGIEEINGERRYARHVKFTGPKAEDIECKLYYDYLGPV
ncbi:hypothetical protein C8R43DRAFT_1048524 [Mycena crocata]|nr:hypothetical protein C8R43DRAFT_1048524 [Mycena crocata]